MFHFKVCLSITYSNSFSHCFYYSAIHKKRCLTHSIIKYLQFFFCLYIIIYYILLMKQNIPYQKCSFNDTIIRNQKSYKKKPE